MSQSSNGDASTQGRVYNSLGFAGVSHDAWGTLTVGRQNALMLDGIRAYDPMAGAYAFLYIGFFGATAGGGVTEDARATTAVKYRVNFANYRFGVLGQFGGYDFRNASQGAIQGDGGADYHVGPGVLSLDAIGGFTRDAVAESLGGGVNLVGIPNPATPQTLTATISNNTNAMVLAKYTIDRLKLYAGYEWMQFAPPSDRTFTCFTDIASYLVCNGGGATSINTTAFSIHDKIFQIVWVGARYSLTDTLDVVGAYYHASQNDFSNGTVRNSTGVVTSVACAVTAMAQSSCAGTQDTVSALLDWKFAPKWDTYIGTMYTTMNGGLDSGFQVHNNWATTAGVRFRW